MSSTVRSTARAALGAAVLAAALAGSNGVAPSTPPPSSAPVTAPPAPVTVARAKRPVGLPTHLSIPAIGVEERLHPVGLRPDGAMQTPDFGSAGWYAPGPRPGAPGPAVLVAHVHGPAGDDVFARLHELTRGDLVVVRRTGGVSRFVVDGVERAPKSALPYDRIWSSTTRPVLRLITCGGIPDPATRTYPDNTIVYAHQQR